MVGMKYCLKCGHIIADNSLFKNDTICCDCKIPLEEDNMTSKQFDTLSDQQKEEYTQSLYHQIKNSDIFDQSQCKFGTPDFYSSYWFDKYEQLTDDVADRYGDDLKQHMQAKYGKGSKLYEEQVVQDCINAERARKQENSNTVKCQYCNSTNVQKITTTSKVVNTALFGIFGTKRHKQFHCNNCGADF